MLLHFSEDPNIELFRPHVPPSNPDVAPAVWAIDEEHSPLYWFPRQCPRATTWARSAEEQVVLSELLATTAHRVHLIELQWLDAVRACELFVYSFDPGPFAPWPDAGGQFISHEDVTPHSVAAAGDLLQKHVEAEIELRLVPSLWPTWDRIVESGLDFSGVRLSNAGTRE